MWRDEIQAWLLARDTVWPWEIFHTIRYEGHPGLWHLLLWIISRFSWDPVWMQVLHGSIATASAYLIWRHSPFPWWVSLPIPFGYFFFYEYGVVARNYSISVLIILLIAHRIKLKWQAGISVGILAGVLCHSNVHSMIIVMGALPWLALIFIWHRYKGRHDAKENSKPVFIGFLIALIGLASSIYQVIPPPDYGYAQGWTFDWNEERALRVSRSVANAYAPVPVNTLHFRNSNTFFSPNEDWHLFTQQDAQNVGITILLLGLIALLPRPYLIPPYLTSTAGILIFFYIKFPGTYRHHGFLMLTWFLMLWLSFIGKPKTEKKFSWNFITKSLSIPLIFLWSFLACWGTWNATSSGKEYLFSNGRDAGNFILKNFGREVLLTGDHRTPLMSTVVGYAQVEKMYNMGNQTWFSYTTWNQEWRKRSYGRQIYFDLLNLSEEFPKKDMIYITDRVRRFGFPNFEFKLLESFSKPATTSEKYVLYQVIPKN